LPAGLNPPYKGDYCPQQDFSMADPIYEPQPITQEAFLADRMRMWGGFTSGTKVGVVVVVVLLILLAFFTL